MKMRAWVATLEVVLEGEVADDAPHGEPADDTMEAYWDGKGEPMHTDDERANNCNAKRQATANSGSCGVTAEDTPGGDATLAAMIAWITALEAEQDEATEDTLGGTSAPGGNGHNCVEVDGCVAVDNIVEVCLESLSAQDYVDREDETFCLELLLA
jgi:hypothetical protein